MNLIIDIGNTRIKAALFNGTNLIEHKVYDTLNSILSDIAFISKAKRAIIGSVVAEHENFYKALNAIMPTLVLTTETKIPLNNQYKSASTLGSDRLAASVGAYYLYPNSNV